jgi:hypothetical protein
MSSEALVEIVFMMVILKIPVVYLGLVVYWAVRAEPRPPEPALLPAVLPAPESGPSGSFRPRRRSSTRRGPRGGPVRTYARRAPMVRTSAR